MKARGMLVLIFFLLCINLFAKDWRKILSENKNIEKIEKISVEGNKILMRGIFIKKLRINKIFTDIDKKKSNVVILLKDLEDAFLLKNKDIKEIKISAENNKLIARGKAKFLGGTWKIYLKGEFYLKDGKFLMYDIKEATIKKIIPVKVPKKIVEKFKRKLNPLFKFEKLGIPVYLKEVKIKKEIIKIR